MSGTNDTTTTDVVIDTTPYGHDDETPSPDWNREYTKTVPIIEATPPAATPLTPPYGSPGPERDSFFAKQDTVPQTGISTPGHGTVSPPQSHPLLPNVGSDADNEAPASSSRQSVPMVGLRRRSSLSRRNLESPRVSKAPKVSFPVSAPEVTPFVPEVEEGETWGDEMQDFLEQRPRKNHFGVRPRVQLEVMRGRTLRFFLSLVLASLIVFAVLTSYGNSLKWECFSFCGYSCDPDSGRYDFDSERRSPFCTSQMTTAYNATSKQIEYVFTSVVPAGELSRYHFDLAFGLRFVSNETEGLERYFPEEEVEMVTTLSVFIPKDADDARYVSLVETGALEGVFSFLSGRSEEQLEALWGSYPMRLAYRAEVLQQDGLLGGAVVDIATQNVSGGGPAFDGEYILFSDDHIDIKGFSHEDVDTPNILDDGTVIASYTEWERIRSIPIGTDEGEWVYQLRVLVEAPTYESVQATSLVPQLVTMNRRYTYTVLEGVLRQLLLCWTLFLLPYFLWKNFMRPSMLENWLTVQIWESMILVLLVFYLNPMYLGAMGTRNREDSVTARSFAVFEVLMPAIFLLYTTGFLQLIPCSIALSDFRVLWIQVGKKAGVFIPSVVLLAVCLAFTAVEIKFYNFTSSSNRWEDNNRLREFTFGLYVVGSLIALVTLVVARILLTRESYPMVKHRMLTFRVFLLIIIPCAFTIGVVYFYRFLHPYRMKRVTSSGDSIAVVQMLSVIILTLGHLFSPLYSVQKNAPPPPHTRKWLTEKWTVAMHKWYLRYGKSLYFFITEDEARGFERKNRRRNVLASPPRRRGSFSLDNAPLSDDAPSIVVDPPLHQKRRMRRRGSLAPTDITSGTGTTSGSLTDTDASEVLFSLDESGRSGDERLAHAGSLSNMHRIPSAAVRENSGGGLSDGATTDDAGSKRPVSMRVPQTIVRGRSKLLSNILPDTVPSSTTDGRLDVPSQSPKPKGLSGSLNLNLDFDLERAESEGSDDGTAAKCCSPVLPDEAGGVFKTLKRFDSDTSSRASAKLFSPMLTDFHMKTEQGGVERPPDYAFDEQRDLAESMSSPTAPAGPYRVVKDTVGTTFRRLSRALLPDDTQAEEDKQRAKKKKKKKMKKEVSVPIFCLESAVECFNASWASYMPDSEQKYKGSEYLKKKCQGEAVVEWFADYSRVPSVYRRSTSLDADMHHARCVWFLRGLQEAQLHGIPGGIRWVSGWLPGGIRRDLLISTKGKQLASRIEAQPWHSSYHLSAQDAQAWRDAARLAGQEGLPFKDLLRDITRVLSRVQGAKLFVATEFDLTAASLTCGEECDVGRAFLDGQLWVMCNLPVCEKAPQPARRKRTVSFLAGSEFDAVGAAVAGVVAVLSEAAYAHRIYYTTFLEEMCNVVLQCAQCHEEAFGVVERKRVRADGKWFYASFEAREVITSGAAYFKMQSEVMVAALDFLRCCGIIVADTSTPDQGISTASLRVSYDRSVWVLVLKKAFAVTSAMANANAETPPHDINTFRRALLAPHAQPSAGIRVKGFLAGVAANQMVQRFVLTPTAPLYEGGKEAIHIEYYGYKLEAVIENAEFELKAIIASSPERVVVSFRGTDNVSNAMIDINMCPGGFIAHEGWAGLVGGVQKIRSNVKSCFCCSKEKDSQGNCFTKAHRKVFGNAPEVHLGFLQAWQSLERAVFHAVRNIAPVDDTRPLFFTGHSLGGALAQIAAYYCTWKLYDFKKKVKVYAFACPRVGNFNFKVAYEAVVPETFRVNINGDPFTNVPPSCGRVRYFHCGTEVHLGRHPRACWTVDPTWLDVGAIPMPRPHSHLMNELKKALNLMVLRFNTNAHYYNRALLPSKEDDSTQRSINDVETEESSAYEWPWVRVSRPDVTGVDESEHTGSTAG